MCHMSFLFCTILLNKKKSNFHFECKFNQSLGYCKQIGIKRRHIKLNFIRNEIINLTYLHRLKYIDFTIIKPIFNKEVFQDPDSFWGMKEISQSVNKSIVYFDWQSYIKILSISIYNYIYLWIVFFLSIEPRN